MIDERSYLSEWAAREERAPAEESPPEPEAKTSSSSLAATLREHEASIDRSIALLDRTVAELRGASRQNSATPVEKTAEKPAAPPRLEPSAGSERPVAVAVGPQPNPSAPQTAAARPQAPEAPSSPAAQPSTANAPDKPTQTAQSSAPSRPVAKPANPAGPAAAVGPPRVIEPSPPPAPRAADAPDISAARRAMNAADAIASPAPKATPDLAAKASAASPTASFGQESARQSEPVTGPTAKAEAPLDPSAKAKPSGMITIEGDTGPVMKRKDGGGGLPPANNDRGGGGGGGGGGIFHKRLPPIDFGAALNAGIKAVRRNLALVMLFTLATNILVLAIPVYLFQISDRVLTSRSTDTLIMLTLLIVGAVILQGMFDAVRRLILMRTAVEVAVKLGSPIVSAAARASLYTNGKEYQTLSDLQHIRSFLTSGTLLALLDVPFAPIFVVVVFLIHPDLGFIVVVASVVLLCLTLLNQRATSKPFADANSSMSKANLHLESMSRNSQIINALAMIPEAVKIWGKDTAASFRSQVQAQDRNITFSAMSKVARMLTQVTMLGWGAHLSLDGQLTGGMVIGASIVAGRSLAPIEAAIEGWSNVIHVRAAYARIVALLQQSPLNFEKLNLPKPEGRLDVERLLFVPQGTKRVVLNGVHFSLAPGDSLAIIGNSGAGKTTLGKMLVGSVLPTSGNVRLDLMDLRNWDQRQFGESIGYLPQDVQLFPATIKANIARMREDATDDEIYQAAKLADVHEMIAQLPHGYETMVAADGAPLSGGQKQRIALARAFFGNPKLLVLDEPNSNLDAAGDVALERALNHAKENNITVITITQRPALLKAVDKILLLVNGTVALFGQRQDVIQALAQRGLSIEGGTFGHQIQ